MGNFETGLQVVQEMRSEFHQFKKVVKKNLFVKLNH